MEGDRRQKAEAEQNTFLERILALSSLGKITSVGIFCKLKRHTLDVLGFGTLGCTAGCTGQEKSFENSSTRSDSLKGCKKDICGTGDSLPGFTCIFQE